MSIPLPHRYHIGDNGGLLSFDEMLSLLEKEGFDSTECLSAGYTVRRLPFCWVFGRAHWAVSLFGANVFVDQVMGECTYICMAYIHEHLPLLECVLWCIYAGLCFLWVCGHLHSGHNMHVFAWYTYVHTFISACMHIGYALAQVLRMCNFNGPCKTKVDCGTNLPNHASIYTYVYIRKWPCESSQHRSITSTFTSSHTLTFTWAHGGSWCGARVRAFIRNRKIHTLW